MSTTKIEWAEQTWNPIIGCSRVSPGCDGCYAVGQVRRGEAFGTAQHVGLTVKPEGGRADWTGEVRLWEPKLDEPLRRRTPTRYFVNSLSDLFHPALPDEAIARVFAVMALAPQHTFMVLTKRPDRIAAWFAYDFLGESQQVLVQEAVTNLTRKLGWARPVIFDGRMVNPDASTPRGRLADDRNYDRRAPLTWPLPNVWLGTSIESDRYAFRADHLRRTPAAVRFISAEPLLGPLPSLDLTGIDWVIVGGESGPGARPMHPDWVRDLRDRCEPSYRITGHDHAGQTTEPTHRPAFFFKQWGEWRPMLADEVPAGPSNPTIVSVDDRPAASGCTHLEHQVRSMLDVGGKPEYRWRCPMYRVGKKAAGRELDGRTWDEFPEDPS